MDYLAHFQMEREPFANAPEARFYYDNYLHAQALITLRYALDNMKGLAVLLGDIGTGKTTLARRMLNSLPEDQYEAGLLVVIHSGITADWLLRRIAVQLGVEKPARDKLALLGQLYRRLVQIYREGRKAVVLIDEAQMLQSREIMEEFRGLLNLEVPGRKLLTFVFFGLPEFEESLKLDPPLHQRVALKYRLGPLEPAATAEYIVHRLQMAGAKQMLFTEESLPLIHRYTGGVPRLINTLCDNALLEAYLHEVDWVDLSTIDHAAHNLGLTLPPEAGTEAPEAAPEVGTEAAVDAPEEAPAEDAQELEDRGQGAA